VGTYPFVSYQFPLFQAAIEGISDHNVFEGRNSSVGERSMLGVVQQVAKGIGNVEVGQLATFDSMFAAPLLTKALGRLSRPGEPRESSNMDKRARRAWQGGSSSCHRSRTGTRCGGVGRGWSSAQSLPFGPEDAQCVFKLCS